MGYWRKINIFGRCLDNRIENIKASHQNIGRAPESLHRSDLTIVELDTDVHCIGYCQIHSCVFNIVEAIFSNEVVLDSK